jgi:hypothetical protein
MPRRMDSQSLNNSHVYTQIFDPSNVAGLFTI